MEEVCLPSSLISSFTVPRPDLRPLCFPPPIGAARRQEVRPVAIDPEDLYPDSRALDRFGIEKALRLRVLPLRPAGAVCPVASPDLDTFRRARPALERELGAVACCIASEDVIAEQIERLRAPTLARRAATRTPERDSCRTWSGAFVAKTILLSTALTMLLGAFRPDILIGMLTAWATLTLLAVTGLRTVAAAVEIVHIRRKGREWASTRSLRHPKERLPTVSILVPLYDERNIASRLVTRLGRLDYPRDRLEVLLILEAGDRMTEEALRAASLPEWMRLVRVPRGEIRTKPRAMNYALDFAKGEIIGVYDAEDAPAPDQLLKVADIFRRSGPEIACVQGVLDFYNARQTWLTRCFSIDYAIWFRLVLPGLVRMGFVIPLGGTTLFFRRDALEGLGRWDAHNVTEDADLGVRLARRGYGVAFAPTVTEEEATASVTAWVRQRSRWIKGYAITWAVHMRDPLRLWGELGTKRFLGVQILFFGTLSQFLLAPLLWSFWLILFGLPHPLTAFAPPGLIITLGALFLLSEIATVATAAFSVASPRHRWLIKWVPMMHLYFPLAAIASWKGYVELVLNPFYWDKTAHGKDSIRRRVDRAARRLRHPA